MVRRAKPPQLYALAVGNLLGITVAPFDRHVAVGVSVYQHVESAIATELGQESDGGGNLAEDGGDLGLDLGFGLVEWRCGS